MREETKKIAEGFKCGYQIFEKGSDPDKLEEAYYKALEEGKENGFYPAILVVDESWNEDIFAEGYYGYYDDNYDKEKLIQECGNNGKELLQERYKEYLGESYDNDEDGFIGDETEGDEISQFCSYVSFEEYELESDTLLLKIPVKNPWELIAWLPLGGWNECPSPEDMIAICKYWFEAYGAIPAVFTTDVMEFYAPDKLNGADSIEVAKEHYAFCTDRVEQGTRSYQLSELAAGLENSNVWYFWWD